jgi:hypothetical protein
LDLVKRLLKDVRVDPRAGGLDLVKRLLKDVREDPRAGDNASYDGHLAIAKRLLKDDRVDPSAGISSIPAALTRCIALQTQMRPLDMQARMDMCKSSKS